MALKLHNSCFDPDLSHQEEQKRCQDQGHTKDCEQIIARSTDETRTQKFCATLQFSSTKLALTDGRHMIQSGGHGNSPNCLNEPSVQFISEYRMEGSILTGKCETCPNFDAAAGLVSPFRIGAENC
jgi:hypothetical protein